MPLLIELSAALQTASGPLWIVGMPFFRHYYTTFSPDTRQVRGERICLRDFVAVLTSPIQIYVDCLLLGFVRSINRLSEK